MALNQTSWCAPENKTLGLLGSNGAGKSTSLNIITGLIRASSGQVFVSGLNSLKFPLKAKKKIGFLPEFLPLYQELSVIKHLYFMCGLRGLNPKDSKIQVDEILEKLHLTSWAHSSIGHLSKGFRQRVGVAQALLGLPEILIFDEPTGGLDPKETHGLREILQKLRGKHTIVLSTHLLPEAEKLCDHIIILHKGEIQGESSMEKIQAQGSLESFFMEAISNSNPLEPGVP